MMKYALVIGNDQYEDPNLSKLKSSTRDSKGLVAVLQDKEIGGFDEIRQVINKTDRETRLELTDFLDNKKPDDLVLVYFSGHGVLDDSGELFLALRDTLTKRLRATALPSAFITDEMDRSRSKTKILILDCCHSGAFERSGTKEEEETLAITENTFKGNGRGKFVITASNSTQFALEGDRVIEQTEFSLFTHYLIQGMETGDADRNQDGAISLDEWYDYAFEKMSEVTSKQTPQRWAYGAQGEVNIARNPNPIKQKTQGLAQDYRHPEVVTVAVPAAYSDYMAYVLATFSKLAYEPFEGGKTSLAILVSKLNAVGFKLDETFDIAGLQGFLARSKNFAVLAFRGEERNWSDIQTDARTQREIVQGGLIRSGYTISYNMVAERINQKVAGLGDLPLYVTGHSIGGALAIVATQNLVNNGFRNRVAACYTFGSPRIGRGDLNRRIKFEIYRVVNTTDIVTLLPFLTFGFVHVGDVRYLEPEEGEYRRGIPSVLRTWLMLKSVFRLYTPLVKDHSINEYIRKLEAIYHEESNDFGKD